MNSSTKKQTEILFSPQSTQDLQSESLLAMPNDVGAREVAISVRMLG
jgi:hypothetical protein